MNYWFRFSSDKLFYMKVNDIQNGTIFQIAGSDPKFIAEFNLVTLTISEWNMISKWLPLFSRKPLRWNLNGSDLKIVLNVQLGDLENLWIEYSLNTMIIYLAGNSFGGVGAPFVETPIGQILKLLSKVNSVISKIFMISL